MPFCFVAVRQTGLWMIIKSVHLPPVLPVYGTHIEVKRLIIHLAGLSPCWHANGMPCLHSESLLEASMPPDEELVDLIEWAFL